MKETTLTYAISHLVSTLFIRRKIYRTKTYDGLNICSDWRKLKVDSKPSKSVRIDFSVFCRFGKECQERNKIIKISIKISQCK